MALKTPLVIYTDEITELTGGDTINALTDPVGDSGELQYNSSDNVAAMNGTYWDSFDEYLGLGTNSPSSFIEVNGDVTADNIGTFAQYDSDSVDLNIDGGSITGITDLAVEDGGTGEGSAQDAITNLTDAGSFETNSTMTKVGDNATFVAPTVTQKHTIQEEGTSLISRRYLDFVGAGLTAEDDAVNEVTKVIIATSTTAAASKIPFTYYSFPSTFLSTIQSEWFPDAAVGTVGLVKNLSNDYEGSAEDEAVTPYALDQGLGTVDDVPDLITVLIFSEDED